MIEIVSDLIQAIGTIGLVAATIGLLYATIQMSRSSKLLVKESQNLYEESKKPRILVKLQPNFDHNATINLVISNVGRGVALNVKFRLDGNDEDMKQHKVWIKGNREYINYLSSGESEIYPFGPSISLLEEPPMDPLTVVVEFEDVDGRSYESRIKLDVAQLKGIVLERSSIWHGVRVLENIERTLKQINIDIRLNK